MDSSNFDRLPAELRNAIYVATFKSPYAVKLKADAIDHPLTTTCRKARQEALEMYLSMTRFNAHINDGPATPVARWLRVMGRHQCLLLREVNIWNMHDLLVTLHGTDATRHMFAHGPDEGGSYVLLPVSRQLDRCHSYVRDVGFALQSFGLGLAQFCEMQHGVKRRGTSHFAILPMAELDGAHADVGDADVLAEYFGLREAERQSLFEQLEDRCREIRISKGRGVIVLDFDDEDQLTCLSQEFVSRDEKL